MTLPRQSNVTSLTRRKGLETGHVGVRDPLSNDDGIIIVPSVVVMC